MKLYRLSKTAYAGDLSGLGAMKFGGRWNSSGNPMVYTSESRALCMLELLVHLGRNELPPEMAFTILDIPDLRLNECLKPDVLPAGWNQYPFHHSSRRLGDTFLQQRKYLMLQVPSALVPEEYNFLINPLHPSFSEIRISRIQAFQFNERFFI